MPRLTPTQLQEITQIIKRYADRFLITAFGTTAVTKADLDALISAKLIPDTTDPKVLEHSYVLGKLKAILTAPEYNNVTFPRMKELAQKLQGPAGVKGPSWVQMEPQTEIERVRIAGARSAAARGVQNLADNIKNGFFKDLEKELGKTVTEAIIKDEIKDTVATATRLRRTVSQLSYDIPRRLKTYTRDWLRVAATEMHQARMHGTADAILQEEGQYAGFPDAPEEKRVIVRPTKGACNECRRDYLDSDGNPIIWKLSELMANGTNIGIPKAQRKPVVPPHHPWPLRLEGTEALTDKGWMPLASITAGQQILGVDLESGAAGWAKAVRIIKHVYTGELDHFHNTRVDLVATPQHRHPVKFRKKAKGRKDAGTWVFVDGENLPKNDWSFLATIPEWSGDSTEEIAVAGQTFPSDVFCELMGWYLSEGCVQERGKEGYNLVISQDPESCYRAEIVELLESIFDRVWAGDGTNVYVPIDFAFGDWLKQLGGHSWEKCIPVEIKSLSKSLLGVFLDAYLKGDGTFRKGRTWKGYQFAGERVYYTSSPQMASDLGELILKVGHRPGYWKDEPREREHHNGTYTSRAVWHIRENRQTELGIRSIKWDKIPVQDEVVGCLELEKYHTFFVRRNGKVVLTGNCLCEMDYIPPGFGFDEDGMLTLLNPEKLYEDVA